MSILTSDIITWLQKALETDKKDWVKHAEPEAWLKWVPAGNTPFFILEKIFDVAAQISENKGLWCKLVCVFSKWILC